MVELSGVETTPLKTINGAIIYIKRDAIDFFSTFSTLPAINPKVIKRYKGINFANKVRKIFMVIVYEYRILMSRNYVQDLSKDIFQFEGIQLTLLLYPQFLYNPYSKQPQSFSIGSSIYILILLSIFPFNMLILASLPYTLTSIPFIRI